MLEHVLQIIGKAIEIVGILRTAGRLISLRPEHLALALLSALTFGQFARRAVAAAEYFGEDDQLGVAHGIALIVTGIMIQMSYHFFAIVRGTYFYMYTYIPEIDSP